MTSARASNVRLVGVLAVLLVALAHATPATAAPANPRFAIALAPISSEVVINWEPVAPTGASTDADVGYRIYRGRAAGGPYTLVDTVTGRWNVSYVDTSPVSPMRYVTRYWYRIASGDLTGWNSSPGVYMTGSPSGVTAENLMSPTTGPPPAPRGLDATVTVDGSTVETVTLTWDAVPGRNIVRYAVYRATSSGNGGTLVGTTTTTGTPTFEDSEGLFVETYYFYRVAAVASDGSAETTGPAGFEFYVRPMSNEELDVPHAGATPGTNSCQECHDAHCAEGTPILCMPADSPEDFCLSCHDGTGSKYDILQDFASTACDSRHPVDAGDYTGGDLTCTQCHTPHGDPTQPGSYKLVSAYGVSEGIEFCLVCHKPDTPDDSTYTTRTVDMTDFRASAHNATGVADPPSGTQIKCRTCHLPHSSPNEDLLMYVGYRACFNCHSAEAGASLTSPDVYGVMTANNDIDAHHDVLDRDQEQTGAGRMACQNCHNSHSATETTPLIDPNDPAPWNTYPKTVSASFSAITDHWENSFCMECHDNSLPTGADTKPWVLPPQWSDPSNDGTATSDHDDITARWANQNHGKRSTSGENLWDDISSSPSSYNPELLCRDCHEAHGTLGVRNLRSDIHGREGLLVVQLPEVTGGSGYDSRFWCMGCHEDVENTHDRGQKAWSTFPRDCSAGGTCHGHQDGAGKF